MQTAKRLEIAHLFPKDSPTPDVGIHENVPFDLYVRWAAVNHSLLKHAGRSFAHVRAAMARNEPEESTEAMIFGTQFHAALLEPERFYDNLEIAPVNPKTEKSYGLDSQKYREAVAENPGKFVVRDEDLKLIEKMVEGVRRHKRARKILAAKGMTEVCAVWIDGATGLICKGRVDFYVPGLVRLDVKTTINAELRAFERDGYNRGYYRQDAFYQDGFEAASGVRTQGRTLAVEKDEPFAAALAPWCADAIAAGRQEIREWLDGFARCVESGEWPGYSDEPDPEIEMDLPQWAYREFNDGGYGGGA